MLDSAMTFIDEIRDNDIFENHFDNSDSDSDNPEVPLLSNQVFICNYFLNNIFQFTAVLCITNIFPISTQIYMTIS